MRQNEFRIASGFQSFVRFEGNSVGLRISLYNHLYWNIIKINNRLVAFKFLNIPDIIGCLSIP